ncbi:MAG: TrkH family potassium uptake protein, partial [Syntrophales bacterium LBB04]|nr:TrkH family potassium uptake protein [Syntrophales bacterium LBB04]
MASCSALSGATTVTGATTFMKTSPSRQLTFDVEYLFETVSAFGTVGLSMNLTPKLDDFQKLAIIFMMFAGRVGPLTLALSLSRTTKRSLTFAEEEIMVG